jgi:hypothetical protein
VSRQQSFTIDHKGELVVVSEIPPDRIPAPNVAVKSAFLPGPKPPGAQITCFTSAKVHILTPAPRSEDPKFSAGGGAGAAGVARVAKFFTPSDTVQVVSLLAFLVQMHAYCRLRRCSSKRRSRTCCPVYLLY